MNYETHYQEKDSAFLDDEVIEGTHVKAIYDALGPSFTNLHADLATRLAAMNQLEVWQNPDTSDIDFRVVRPSFGIDDNGDVYFAPTASDLTEGEEAVIQLGVDGVLSFVRFDEIV